MVLRGKTHSAPCPRSSVSSDGFGHMTTLYVCSLGVGTIDPYDGGGLRPQKLSNPKEHGTILFPLNLLIFPSPPA